MSDFVAAPRVLVVPGYGNSGPQHWQTLWEQAHPDTVRADLGSWDRPERAGWVARLDAAITASPAPVILVAHSLGCIAAAWWVAERGQAYGAPVAGALLVAPPDCERGEAGRFDSFRGLPNVFLPFPSIVVASRNDPYAEFSWASFLARRWGSFLVDAGDCGHINADSGIGDWPFGARLLDRLVFAAKGREQDARLPERRAAAS
ncbi:RBBP9/YdeN family alpha/beta hydrolase [Sphingosinicella microcystinivorans]|uniref:RBBP9/YdeN family alpha/beta hydrolase n=1 Tax=Sphingosinicella microcystinivorans TaxID=335406 RepID=UPI0022F3E713|nr:alpha/beta fold hydrolase [Sphingosinicella microcystinivorans]WBX86079.1 alpha/beta fold hydrolase [Sphingosinicella microcystinivorans]